MYLKTRRLTLSRFLTFALPWLKAFQNIFSFIIFYTQKNHHIKSITVWKKSVLILKHFEFQIFRKISFSAINSKCFSGGGERRGGGVAGRDHGAGGGRQGWKFMSCSQCQELGQLISHGFWLVVHSCADQSEVSLLVDPTLDNDYNHKFSSQDGPGTSSRPLESNETMLWSEEFLFDLVRTDIYVLGSVNSLRT